MMRAPFATAQRIAFASASTGIDRSGPTTFATRSSAGGARPAIPRPSFVWAAIRPATNVPCPWVSTVADPPTKLFDPTIRPRSSGCLPSMPESMTATRTDARGRARARSRTRDSGSRTTGARGTGRSGGTRPSGLEASRHTTHRRGRAARPRGARRRRAHESVEGRRSGSRRGREVAPQPPCCLPPGRRRRRSERHVREERQGGARRRRPPRAARGGRPSGHCAASAATVTVNAGPAHAVRDEPIGRRELRPHRRDERRRRPRA